MRENAWHIIFLFFFFLLILLIVVADTMPQVKTFMRSHLKSTDVIERSSEIEVLWFVDENSLVRQTDTSYWARTEPLNLINNAGAADTVKLFGMKNELLAFQAIFMSRTDSVDSVEAYIDSLVGTGYTIKNDSGRTISNVFRYA